MNELYQNIASGELKDNPARAYQMAADGPVVVLSRTQPQVVMVSPEMWNTTALRLKELEALVAIDAAAKRVWSGEYDTVEDVEAAMAG